MSQTREEQLKKFMEDKKKVSDMISNTKILELQPKEQVLFQTVNGGAFKDWKSYIQRVWS